MRASIVAQALWLLGSATTTHGQGFANCFPDGEPVAIAGSAGVVRRDSQELRIELENGHTADFTDVAEQNSRSVAYVYCGQMPPPYPFHVVRYFPWEGGGYILVSPSGMRVHVVGAPVLAPNSSRFFAVSISEFYPDLLEIWSMDADGMHLELSIQSDLWRLEAVQWESDSVITVAVAGRVTHELRRIANGWQVLPR